MILQTRDIEILKFIDKFGYVTSVHIQNFFELKQSRASQILSRLIKNDFLKKERILTDEPNIFTLRTAGAELIKSHRIKKITLQNLRHNLLLVDIFIDLKLKNPELEILSDRELRAGRGFGAKGHIPDMEIITPIQDGRKNIAIELELSRKSLKRVKSILYALENKYIETHYYCDNSVFDHIKRAVELKRGFKVFNYFKLEETPQIAEVVQKIENNVGAELKDYKIKITRLESDKKVLSKDLDILQSKVDRFKKRFESLDIKKSTFGGSYSLSSEELENIKQFLKEL
jgi:DNA-binding MarR family transcriptional regulator